MEVFLTNPWLTYGIGLHRLRESGLAWGFLDCLDERPLTFDEIWQLCCDLFVDGKGQKLHHPDKHFGKFMKDLLHIMKKEKLQYNPVKKKTTCWIDLNKLERMYRDQHPRPSPSGPKVQQKGQAATSKPSAPRIKQPESLQEVIQAWSHQPPDYDTMQPLATLLVSVPNKLFHPTNIFVESHEYFEKWTVISAEAFSENGDELSTLLKRAMKKVKLFLHPDKLPRDLTDDQTLLLTTMWEVLMKSEGVWVQ